MTTTVFHRLLAQALPHCNQREAAGWPCEGTNRRHWQTIAAEGRWRVCIRVEPDCDCGPDYEVPPPIGTEWVGVVVQLQDQYGKAWRTKSTWAVESPGMRTVDPTEWQQCEAHIAEVAADLVRELLYSPIGLISNIEGEIAERQSMIAELQEIASVAA
jgi:hypothetical protein